jgi:type VI secretion system secreted protein VgrG
MARTQSTRQAELITPLGPDTLLFHQMVAHEGMSQLFEYDLVVLSDDENICLTDLLGQHAHVELELPNDATRFFCGHATRFSFVGFQGNLAKYMVKLRPWLWFLTQAQNNRIFQNKTVPEIVKSVCNDHGFTDIDDRLTDSYDSREFCVQYRESDFDFVSRLLEEEGIYYYFVHEAGKHELVLADAISAHAPFGNYDLVPWYPPDAHDHRERDHIDHWELCQTVRSGKYAMRDFNFEKPQNSLEAKAKVERPIEHGDYEVYDYPGRYREVVPGEKFARKRIEALQAEFEVMNGSGNARGLQPGHLFTLENHDRDDQNREYLILSVTHDVTQDDYDSTSAGGSDSFNYGCSLQAMPSSEPFRPPRVTPRPIVHGPQTAYVVGDAGEEIWTDKHGRVKVEFHWDRADQNNSNSSCWVRVSQSWAGKQWGAQFLPRIGHEVIVEFLEGDPDRPIITGAVYNEGNKPPYDLPANATQSGIKTRSSKGGNADNFNEFRFEDKKGSEQIYMHAEKDRSTVVEHDDTLEIGNNRAQTVDKNETIHVKANRDESIDGNLDQKIGGNQTISVGGNDDQSVQGNRDVAVSKDHKLDVTGNSEYMVLGNWTHRSMNIDMTAMSSIAVSAMGGGIDILSVAPIQITAPAGVVLNDSMITSTSGTVTETAGAATKSAGSCTETCGSSSVAKGFDQAYKGFDITMKASGLSVSGLSLEHTTLKVGSPGLELKKVGSLKMEGSGFKIDKSGFSMIA